MNSPVISMARTAPRAMVSIIVVVQKCAFGVGGGEEMIVGVIKGIAEDVCKDERTKAFVVEYDPSSFVLLLDNDEWRIHI